MTRIHLLLGIVALSTIRQAFAAPVLVGTPTSPGGVNGLVVQGTTYNVTFRSTSTGSPFSFGTTEGQAAAAALAQAMNDLGVVGLNDVRCTAPFGLPSNCALYVDQPVSNMADAAFLGLVPHWLSLPLCIVDTPGCGIVQGLFVAWTVATPEPAESTPQAVTAIRSPLALAFLSLGLFGLALTRRRRKQ